MDNKSIRHGNHILGNDTDGYMYNFNTSEGYSFNSHIHSCYEFIHIIRGELIYTVEENEYMLTEGDVIMTNPNELHSFYFPNESVYQREFLHIYPGFIRGYPEITKNLKERRLGYFNRIPSSLVKKYEIDTIFKQLENCCADVQPETDYIALGLTILLFSKISRILREETPDPQIIVQNKKNNHICSYIDHHYMEKLSLADIAEAAYISPSHLSRTFKKETGMTIKAYLTMRRITRAKNLILEGQRTITEIYLDCGFVDYSTFYRSFVKYIGMSPDEFRQAQRNKI